MKALDEKTVKEILEANAQGMTQKQISEKLGVVAGTVSKYIRLYQKPGGIRKTGFECQCGNLLRSKDKYCSQCGKMVKTPEQIMCDRLRKAISSVSGVLPSNIVDEVTETMREAIKMIGDLSE